MATDKNKAFLLVSILGTQTKIEKEGPITMVQFFKKKWSAEPQWKKYKFQVRSPEGYKAVKIWTKKGQIV